jgi:hypothetical protein
MQQPLFTSICNGGDIRNVARANDTPGGRSYARDMTDRTRREHTMKHIATIGAVVTAFAVAPSLAAGGNLAAQVKTQVSAQVIRTQVANTQVAKQQRVTAAVSVERHLVQIKLARRLAELRPLVR